MRYFVRVFDKPQRHQDYESKRGKTFEVFKNGNDNYVPRDNSSVFWKDDTMYDKYVTFLNEETVTSELCQAIYGGISE